MILLRGGSKPQNEYPPADTHPYQIKASYIKSTAHRNIPASIPHLNHGDTNPQSPPVLTKNPQRKTTTIETTRKVGRSEEIVHGDRIMTVMSGRRHTRRHKRGTPDNLDVLSLDPMNPVARKVDTIQISRNHDHPTISILLYPSLNTLNFQTRRTIPSLLLEDVLLRVLVLHTKIHIGINIHMNAGEVHMSSLHIPLPKYTLDHLRLLPYHHNLLRTVSRKGAERIELGTKSSDGLRHQYLEMRSPAAQKLFPHHRFKMGSAILSTLSLLLLRPRLLQQIQLLPRPQDSN